MREDADKVGPGTKFIMRCLPLTAINPDNVETLLQQPRPEGGADIPVNAGNQKPAFPPSPSRETVKRVHTPEICDHLRCETVCVERRIALPTED